MFIFILKPYSICYSTKIMSNLGILAQKRGDTAEARKYFMAVLEFDPKDVIAKQALKDMEA